MKENMDTLKFNLKASVKNHKYVDQIMNKSPNVVKASQKSSFKDVMDTLYPPLSLENKRATQQSSNHLFRLENTSSRVQKRSPFKN